MLWKAFCLSLSKTFAVSFLRADGIKEKLSATEHDPASESSQVDFTRLLPGFGFQLSSDAGPQTITQILWALRDALVYKGL